MLTTRPRGTNDILPGEVEKWQQLEEILRQTAGLYGYREIRTPVFEHTELFQRGVGETTDIVEKEMYTFMDRGQRSLTLRPEATASVVRAFVENKLFAEPQPTKLYYIGPMFRYDRPQAGRYRQFHQFDVEVLGSNEPMVDAEVIAMAMDIYRRLGLKGLQVELNSVGCPVCRPVHRQALLEFFGAKKSRLCPTCQDRYQRNPLRILDCKSPVCQELAAEAPNIDRHLCPNCASHFEAVCEQLEALGVPYRLNPRLVRGLDYYVQTAFEIVAEGIGAQSSVGGGGRYDGLIEQIGGPALPGIGFALGMERILLAMEKQGIKLTREAPIDVYIAPLGDKAQIPAALLAQILRQAGLAVERDYLRRSLKAQLKAADRFKVKYSVILGDDEVLNKQAVLRDMQDSSQMVLDLDDVEGYLRQELHKEDAAR